MLMLHNIDQCLLQLRKKWRNDEENVHFRLLAVLSCHHHGQGTYNKLFGDDDDDDDGDSATTSRRFRRHKESPSDRVSKRK